MSILITGVGGFISETLVNTLSSLDKGLIGTDKVSAIKPEISRKLTKYIQCDAKDLSKLPKLQQSETKIDTIIHLAGESGTGSSKQTYDDDNIQVTVSVGDYAAKNNIAKIIFLSTYKALDGQGEYALSKKISEDHLLKICRDHNIELVILRCSHVFGIGMKGNIIGWLNKMKKYNLPRMSESQSLLPMIGIQDLCDVIASCVLHDEVNNKIYLVSDGNKYSINDIENTARSILIKRTDGLVLPRWLIYCVSKLGDILLQFKLRIPLNSGTYNMLFKSTNIIDNRIFVDTGIYPKQNFMQALPEILGNTSDH